MNISDVHALVLTESASEALPADEGDMEATLQAYASAVEAAHSIVLLGHKVADLDPVSLINSIITNALFSGLITEKDVRMMESDVFKSYDEMVSTLGDDNDA